jgi:hypothetical protein
MVRFLCIRRMSSAPFLKEHETARLTILYARQAFHNSGTSQSPAPFDPRERPDKVGDAAMNAFATTFGDRFRPRTTDRTAGNTVSDIDPSPVGSWARPVIRTTFDGSL